MSCELLCFRVVDVPPEGMRRRGEVSPAAIGIEDEPRLRCPHPLQVDVFVARVQNGLLVTGELATVLATECDRCLEPIEVEVKTRDVCHYIDHVDEPVVDLTEDIREDILLAFPQACLCRETCRGLCLQCGQNLNKGECSCATGTDDGGVWRALDGLEVPPDTAPD